MDIRNYITFNTIVELEGFTKAAQKLNYAQSTVTLHIKELEEHYKQKLFDRIGKKIHLTGFGSGLYDESKKLVESYSKILSSNLSNNAVIRIGVYESLLKYRLITLIHDFKKAHPNIDVVIKHGTCITLREDIRNGDLDLAFQIEPERNFVDMTITNLCEERFSLILPKGLPAAEIHKGNHTVFFTEQGCSYRRIFERFLDEEGILVNQVMETGSTDLIKQYVGLGMGYSMLPSVTLCENTDQQMLEIFDFPLSQPLFTQLIHHKDKYVFEAMQDFIDAIMEAAGSWDTTQESSS